MAFFGVDSTLPSTSPDAATSGSASQGGVVRGSHPSAPIPVQGPSVGSNVRVPLGESGSIVFPLILGAAEFGWNVDLESSHAILDTYAELGGNAVHTADSYSSGRSEHIIGRWMATRGIRDDVVVGVRLGGHPVGGSGTTYLARVPPLPPAVASPGRAGSAGRPRRCCSTCWPSGWTTELMDD